VPVDPEKVDEFDPENVPEWAGYWRSLTLWYVLRVELIHLLWVDGHAHAPSFGMDAEGRFEQMVAVF